jgi:hypothetical protein
MVGFQKEVQVSAVWRFYVGQDQKWRWQRLTIHQVVISESHAAYKDYVRCVADAQEKGYVFQASQPKRAQREMR